MTQNEITLNEAQRSAFIAALEYTRGALMGAGVDNPYEDVMIEFASTVMTRQDILWEANQK